MSISAALEKARPLKVELRLAQAVSQFEAELPADQKAAFRAQRSHSCRSPPTIHDVMRLTAEIDSVTSTRVGGHRCFGPRFTNVLQAVQQFAALGDVVVGGSQNIIACGVWSLVRMTLLSLVNRSSHLDRLSTLLMVVGRSAPRYQRMALLYANSRTLQSHLSEYFIVVVRLCHHLLKLSSQSLLTQLVSFLSDAEMKTYESELDLWATAIKEEADVLMGESINAQSSRMKTLLKLSVSESHRQKLRAHLRFLDACSTYDHEAAWKEARKLGNTTLFSSSQEYTRWRSQTRSSTMLCRGKLGSGKSVLLANLVNDLNLYVPTDEVPVAFFFSRHDISESRKARSVIGSLARQLLRSAVHQDVGRLANETALALDSDEIVGILKRALPSHFRAYFVLDGLDECDEKERDTILEHLQTLQCTFTLLVCVSFRSGTEAGPEPVSGLLAGALLFKIPEDNPDIERFIIEELQGCVASGKLVVGNPAIVLEIRDALLRGAQGMFLWVALQIGSLCDAKTDQSIRETLADLPRDLAETFSR